MAKDAGGAARAKVAAVIAIIFFMLMVSFWLVF
jgi:hypothetical protein